LRGLTSKGRERRRGKRKGRRKGRDGKERRERERGKGG